MTLYHHRQFGLTLFYTLGIGAVICFVIYGVFRPVVAVPLVVGSILMVCAVLFSSLSIEITGTHLRWSFGPGILRKEVLLADISDAEVTRTKFMEGWGIHLTRRGWLYNVSGWSAVVVKLKTGKQFLLGTDDAERLSAILREISRESGSIRKP